MIFTSFAQNESKDDAFLSLSLLAQPWKWKKGDEVHKLKKSILTLFKTPKHNVHFFLTGRAALFHYLKELHLPAKSEVIIQGFTCTAVATPITANKLMPVYVDIDPHTYCMDTAQVEKKITKNTKLLILQHTFGITPNREKIISLAKKNDILVIEDLAHGFDRKVFHDSPLETVKLLSFGRSKALSSVFGGAIVTPDKKISKKLETIEKKFPAPSGAFIFGILAYKPLAVLIKNTYDVFFGRILHFVANKLGFLTPEITKQEKKGLYDPKMDKTYPNACARLLVHQMKKFRKMQKQRASITKFYNDYFAVTDANFNLRIPKYTPLSRYPVIVEDKIDILRKMKRKGIGGGDWYPQPVAPKGLPLHKVKYEFGSCPKVEYACEHVINLPTYISRTHAKKIVEFFKEYEHRKRTKR